MKHVLMDELLSTDMEALKMLGVSSNDG